MGILTVRLSDEEEQILARRAKTAKVKKATLVRQLIRAEPFVTGEDILTGLASIKGDQRFKIRRK